MNEKDLNIEYIMKQIRSLSEMEQKAICWLIRNIEIADHLTKGEKISEMEIRRLMQAAIEKDDYTLLALVLYKKNKDK